MLETSARLLRLLSLLQSRFSWAGPELAERLGVNARTVRRDVDRLRELGYPVEATPGLGGGYSLGAGAQMPPLLLDDDEALSVVFGLQGAAGGAVHGMEESALRALTKLQNILPSRLRKRVADLKGAFIAVPFAGPRVDPERLSVIATACREQQEIAFAYGDRLGRRSERSVEPYGLVYLVRRWYLAAFDPGRADFRTFRVDRIAGEVRPGRRFAARPLPEEGLAAYVQRSVGAAAYPVQARVLFHAPVEVMGTRIPPNVGVLRACGPERCEFLAGAPDMRSLLIHVAVLDVDFEVLEPAELADEVRRLAARLLTAAAHTAADPSTRRSSAGDDEGAAV